MTQPSSQSACQPLSQSKTHPPSPHTAAKPNTPQDATPTQTLTRTTSSGLLASALIATCFYAPASLAEQNRVVFPTNLDELVHYTTVRRGNITEHMLTSQEAIDAVAEGEDMPNGTQVILVDYREGEVYRYFVMEKGEGWGEDYPAYRRTADWQFQWYWPDGRINTSENTQRCQSCHESRERDSYMYTFDDLKDYIARQ